MHKCKKHPCPKPETCKCRTVREANVPIVWLLGGTGSGKNTVGTALTAKYGFDYLNTGELLRTEAKSGSRRGAEYERAIAAGRLIGDDDIVQMLERIMKHRLRQTRGYVLCFAKNVQQAELFERYIAPADLIVQLHCSAETMKARATARAAAAGANMELDDVGETIDLRIQQYRAGIEEILTKYGARVRRVDAEGGVADVLAVVEPLVEEVTARKLAETPKPTCDPPEPVETEAAAAPAAS